MTTFILFFVYMLPNMYTSYMYIWTITRSSYLQYPMTGVVVNISRFFYLFLILISRNGRQCNLCQIFDEKLYESWNFVNCWKNYREQIHRFAVSHTKMVKTTNFPVNKRWATIHNRGKMLTCFFNSAHCLNFQPGCPDPGHLQQSQLRSWAGTQ